MACSKAFLNHILSQLLPLEDISHRQMMGEYILYFHGKVAAYLCDDRLLVKPLPAALRLLPEAPRRVPYPGAKEMLLVQHTEDAAFMRQLFIAMEPELPASKPRKRPHKA